MKISRMILVMVGIAVMLVGMVIAVPLNPVGPTNITQGLGSRLNESSYPPIQILAEAGNVTELTISTLTQTQTWQGYYGQITGTITLDDASGWTLYDWYTAYPNGEIYAASATVDNWLTVHCFNYSNNGSARGYCWNNGTDCTNTTNVLNLTELESGGLNWSLGLEPTDEDGVDETFNESGTVIVYQNGSLEADAQHFSYVNHVDFFVGTVYIEAGSCPATNTYEATCINKTVTDVAQQFPVDPSWCGTNPELYEYDGARIGDHFQEVLLTENNSETIIYTTIIENHIPGNDTAIIGFNNDTQDFQMLVGDDGHGDEQDFVTPYYFYVEIE